MTTHTPGPWKAQKVVGSFQVPFHVVAGKKLVATCSGNQLAPDESSIAEARANAALIAAAPDLLVALERLLPLWEEAIGHETDYMDMADFARDAIKRAKS